MEKETDRLIPLKSHGSAEVKEVAGDKNCNTTDCNDPKPKYSLFIGCIFVGLSVMGYSTAFVMSQVSGLKTNVFQIHTIRYFLILTVSFSVMLYKGYNFKIQRSHLKISVLCACFHCVYEVAFYTLTSFVSLGNLDGMRGGMSVLMAVFYDVYKKRISKECIISAIVSFLGILFLSQPWGGKHLFTMKRDKPPCEVWAMEWSLQNGTKALAANVTTETSGNAQIYAEASGYIALVFIACMMTTV